MGSLKQTHPLKVYLSDISPHSQAILEFFIGSTGGKSFALVSSPSDAEAYITDFDYPGSREHWEKEHANSAKPCIALSIEDPGNPLVEWVSKPITAKDLVAAAATISTQLREKTAESPKEHSGRQYATSQPEEPTPSPRNTFKRPPSLPGLPNIQSPFRKKRLHSKSVVHTKAKGIQHTPVIQQIAEEQDDVAVAEKPVVTPVNKQAKNLSSTNPQAFSSTHAAKSDSKSDKNPVSEIKKTETNVPDEPDLSSQQQPTKTAQLDFRYNPQRWELLCGTHENVSHSTLKQNESLIYNSENFFLGTLIAGLRLARQTKQVVQIKYEPYQFYICYDEFLIFSPLHPQSDNYDQLCFNKVKPGQVNLHILATQESNEIRKRIQTDANFTYDLESFIWTTCLLTSRGRVPSTLDCETDYLLKYWPNFTRIETFPFAMKIAARWQKRPYTLSKLAREMDVPIRYVIAFYNGAIGLSLFETDTAKLEQKEATEPTKNKGLIARLFGRLTRNEATSQ